mgnify:CR=1 FL=1
MKNKIFITISIIVTLLFYYLIYDYQRSEIDNLNSQLNNINEKLDSLLDNGGDKTSNRPNNENSMIIDGRDYKKNNIIKDKIVNFADSLNILLENSQNEISEELKEEMIDTVCYELSEQYKIINFYKNKIRIKNILKPGSILMSINDTLSYKNSTYILKEINGEDNYIKLYNKIDQSDCKFHKITP